MHVVLKGEIGILNFHNNLCTQGIHYKFFIFPSDEINDIEELKYTNMDCDARDVVATTLYSRFNQIGTIDNSYTEAKNLSNTTTDGL